MSVLLWCALAWADPSADELPVPVDPAVAEIWDRGLRFEAAEDPASAAVAYRIVVRSDPSWTPGVLALGRVLEEADRMEEASEVYRRSAVPEVLAARARVELALERPEGALRTLARLRRVAPSAEVVRLQTLAEVEVDAVRSAERFRDFVTWRVDRPDTGLPVASVEEQVATLMAVIDALVEADEAEEATLLLSDTVTALPEYLDIEPVEERLDRLLLDAEARQWMRSGAVALDPLQQARLEDAEEALRQGDMSRAGKLLQPLLTDAPRAPEVWATQARIALVDGDVAVADDALQRAEFLAPSDPNYAAAMGDLLSTRYGGREDAAAVEAYRRALRRDPVWSQLWWRQALVQQRAGLGDRGEHAFQRYLELEPAGEHADEARQRLEDLARERPPAPPLPEEPEPPEGVSYDALLAYHRVGVLRGRGDREAALDEVRRVRALAPGFADAVNLEASLFLDVGDRVHAIDAYRRSLDMQPDQPGVVLTLWELLRREGRMDEATALVAQAQANGIGDVHFLLARAAWEAGEHSAAAEHLADYESTPHTARFETAAVELRTAISERRRRMQVAIGGLIATVLGVLALLPLVRWWRGPGCSLEDVVSKHPEVARAITQTVAEVRHDILKHDTTILFEVADGLESDDAEAAQWAAERLFSERGTVARFHEQLASLQALAGQVGMRLDLTRSDEVFAPMVGAMKRLSALRGDLRRGKARAAPELRRIATALNHDGFAAVGRLVHSLSVLELDEALVADVVERVEAEPGVGGAGQTRVVHSGEVIRVRSFRREIEDIVANLVRNARMASPDEVVEVHVALEVDPLTLLEEVTLAVCDKAPGRLTTVDIRERPSDRGLGIARTLVSQSRGTLTVEPRPGWAKAVVVRLPAVEPLEEA